MSAYLVSDETINVIAWGLVNYGVSIYGVTPQILVDKTAQLNGEALLKQNYKSLAARYGDDETPHNYTFSRPKEYNEGILLGCVKCYMYQSCETDDWMECDIRKSLMRLQYKMLHKMIESKGMDIPWGVE